MRNLFVIAFLFIATTGFAQEQNEVKGNKVTIKEVAPIWPGCEKSKDTKACFNQKLMQHVQENYKYPKDKDGEYIRGKSTISMEVNEEGDVVVHSVKGPKEEINNEAERMIKQLPKMKPGQRAGKAISKKYTIPFNF